MVEKEVIYNAEIDTPLFFGKNKKRVILFNGDELTKVLITENNFKPFEVKSVNEIDNRKNSLKILMELLSAEDFAEWCKDRGIEKIIC